MPFILQVVGPFTSNVKEIMGDYAPATNRKYIKTPLEGLRDLSQNTRSANGCNDPSCQTYDSSSVKTAVNNAEVVFVCLGTGKYYTIT